MGVVLDAGTRIVRFRTRFCLAPTSSSPSTSRTGRSPFTTTFSSDTWPASLTSVIWAQPPARASSRVRYSTSRSVALNNGTIDRFWNADTEPNVTCCTASAKA